MAKRITQRSSISGPPRSMDGLIARELGVEIDDLLDFDARELVFDDRWVGLSRLEFGVMHYLHQHEGKAVTRRSLLSDVWGYDYEGGSNVVDVGSAVVARENGSQARVLETVSGVGYRFRRG